MRAIILAAGQGARLMPLTADRPKCMVALAGQPLLHYLLDSMRKAGVDDIVVVAGHHAARLDAPGCRKVLNSAFADTNMVGTLFAAASFMEEGSDLLVSYADTVFEPNVIRKVLDQRVGDIAIASDDCWQRLWSRRMTDPLCDAETFRVSQDGRVLELGRKPMTVADIQGQYMGLFKIKGDRINDFKHFYGSLDRTVEYDRQSFRQMYMTTLLQALIDDGWHAQAVRTKGGWLEVDSIEDLQLYESLARRGELDDLCRLRATRVL